VRQALHLPRLNEYHGCMVDSILKSHESSVLNDSLRGMCSIPQEKLVQINERVNEQGCYVVMIRGK
jgi:hypothetical protein